MKRGRKTLVIFISVILLVVLIIYLVKGTKNGALQMASSPIRISEVMTSNKGTVPDDTGDYPDWVEIENTSGEEVDIGGYGLSDDKIIAAKWTFPSGMKIEPYGRVIVWCSGDSNKGAMHAGFKLSANDELILTTSSGTVIDDLKLHGVTAGYTLARDEAGNWVEKLPSPGYANTDEGAAQFLETLKADDTADVGVYINEFMASNASVLPGPHGDYCDWIELYNTTSAEVDLSGYGISDVASQPLKFALPEGTKIPANGFLLIYCTGVEGTDPNRIEVPFGLRAYKESVVFSTPEGRILDSYDYERMESDTSCARMPDGRGSWGITANPTPGYPNTAEGVASYQATLSYGTGDLVISEIMAANRSTITLSDGTTPDWIEIRNNSDRAIDLGGYALSKNAKNPAKWVFPNVTLGAGQHLAVLCTGNNVKDPTKTLETNFSLSREGDKIFLFSPDAKILDRFEFGTARNDISVGRDTNGQILYYAAATPGTANTGGVPGIAKEPVFSVEAGVYGAEQSISIDIPDGSTVYYTLDGTVPTSSSTRYSGPIKAGKGVTTLRAVASQSGWFDSKVVSATYIVHIDGTEASYDDHTPTLPVISIVTDPDYFFGSVRGIYVAGADYESKSGGMDSWASFVIKDNASNKYWKYANFNAQHRTHPDPMGTEWERPAHVDYLSRDGKLLYQGDLTVRIFGAYSRYDPQKGMALVARSENGDSSIDFPFFDNRPYTSYKSLTLRASAKDWMFTKMRDILIQGLLEDGGSTLATQAYVQSCVYVNGQYWGVYNIREKVNKYFLAQHYGVGEESIDLLVGNGSTEQGVISGNPNSYKDYQALVTYAGEHDLSDSSNYAYVCSLMDVDNFAEYCAMEIYVGNTDTGNIKFWRSSELDGKWRWIPYDFDWAFNYEGGTSSLEGTTGWRRDFFKKYFHPDGHGANKGFSTVLSRALLKNKEFRALFLQKCAMMYDIFSTDKMIARINELEANIDGEMPYDCKRWATIKYTTWQKRVAGLRESAENVPEYFLYYCQNYFNLSDSDMNTLFGRKSKLTSVS